MKEVLTMFASHVRFPLACCLALAVAFLLGCSVGNPLNPSGEGDAGASPTALQGERFVQARRCAQCHQSANPDDGVLSGQTLPQPGTHAYGRNLTPDPATGIGGWSDETLLLALRSGVDDQGAHLCAPMPQFTTMGDGEGVAIVAYLRSLAPVTRIIPASECAGDDFADDDGGLPTATAGDDGGATTDAGLPIWDGGGDVLVVADVDSGGDGGACTLIAPSVPANCTGCSTSRCQANGCYGGSWCQASTRECHRKPANCP
ncbi:MAG: c-type cytochrome [Polyangiaceae bacterium]